MKNKNEFKLHWYHWFVVIAIVFFIGVLVMTSGEDESKEVGEKEQGVKEEVVKKEVVKKVKAKPKSFVEKYANEDYRVIVDEFLKLDDTKRKEIDGRDMYGDKENWIVNKKVKGNGVVVDTDTMQYEDLVFTIYIGDKPFKNDASLDEYYEEEYIVTVRLMERVTIINEGDNIGFEGTLTRIMDNYHYIDSSTITKE